MGLFGKLFEKKECSVCGGEIGLLGNRKLEDGNLCKNCAAKYPPSSKSTVGSCSSAMPFSADKSIAASTRVRNTIRTNHLPIFSRTFPFFSSKSGGI